MFKKIQNKQDIFNWDTSNVENMNGMFRYSKFNQDISNWNIKSLKYCINMFMYSKIDKIPEWYHSYVDNYIVL